jgi:uncharacterized DUF497 family protein
MQHHDVIHFVYITVRYEWDEVKNRANLAKHGIRVEAAIGVFDDPDCVIEPSYDDPETGDRWLAIDLRQPTSVN